MPKEKNITKPILKNCLKLGGTALFPPLAATFPKESGKRFIAGAMGVFLSLGLNISYLADNEKQIYEGNLSVCRNVGGNTMWMDKDPTVMNTVIGLTSFFTSPASVVYFTSTGYVVSEVQEDEEKNSVTNYFRLNGENIIRLNTPGSNATPFYTYEGSVENYMPYMEAKKKRDKLAKKTEIKSRDLAEAVSSGNLIDAKPKEHALLLLKDDLDDADYLLSLKAEEYRQVESKFNNAIHEMNSELERMALLN